MDKKRCFLIGHHDAPESIYPALQREIERHITELGVTEFIVGHYGNFDRMAARALVTAKQIHPEIFLWLLLPYHPAEQKVKAPEGFDGSLYPEGLERVPRRIAIVRANRSVVDHVHFLMRIFAIQAVIRKSCLNTQIKEASEQSFITTDAKPKD